MATRKLMVPIRTISEYVEAAPEQSRAHLLKVMAAIRGAAPDASEGLKWGKPAFSHEGILVMVAAYKHHIGFYPTPSVVGAFKKELLSYKTSAASIQFPIDQPVPVGLIRKITRFRVNEFLNKEIKWKT